MLSYPGDKMAGMGNLYEYFAAPDHGAAARALAESPEAAGFLSLGMVKGLEPSVQLGALEALLYDVDLEHVTAAPWHCALVDEASEDGPWVVTVTDTLRDALVTTSEAVLREVALRWARTSEFRGSPPQLPSLLEDFLRRFAVLARTAATRSEHLYCWASL